MVNIAKIGSYSVYFTGPYLSNFKKLYKGIIVVIDTKPGTKDFHFAIRTKKVNDTIFKTANEAMEKLVFNDNDKSIECIFDRNVNNKSKNILYFGQDEYDELKKNIIDIMSEFGLNEYIKIYE